MPFPEDLKRVQTNDPPAHLLHDAMAHVSAAVATLPPDADAALIGVATDAGANAAIVAKGPMGMQLLGWVGKTWGDKITYGAEVQKVWKFR